MPIIDAPTAQMPPEPDQNEHTPADRGFETATAALAAALQEFGEPAEGGADLATLAAAAAARLSELRAAREAAQQERDEVTHQRDALRSLIGGQRGELRDLREQLIAAHDRLREHLQTSHRQFAELNAQLAGSTRQAEYARVQADAVYAVFQQFRSVINNRRTLLTQVIGDEQLYPVVLIALSSGLFDDDYFREQYDPAPTSHLPPVLNYLRDGDASGCDPHPLFQGAFYRAQLPESARWENALLHYLREGSELQPNPLFLPAYYLQRYRGLEEFAGISPLVHYRLIGAAEGADPHPLFEVEHYRQALEAAGVDWPEDPLSHFLQSGADAPSPHPLFDADFYREKYLTGDDADANPLVHYLTVGDRAGHNPHPLFHTRFYRLAETELDPTQPALTHFVMQGADAERAPHPMFDPGYYKRANPQVKETGYRLLVHFAERGEAAGLNPHPLIDLAYVSGQLNAPSQADETPFLALLSRGKVNWLSPHPLFDVEFYRAASPRAARFAGGAFLFYLLAGYKLDDSPHRLFDPAYYRAQALAQGIKITDPLVHFVEGSGGLVFNPHPLFDTAYYRATNPGLVAGNPLRHYLERGDRERRNPHPLFDVAYYRRRARLDTQNALLHYAGRTSFEGAGADPHPLFDTAHYLSQLPAPLPAGETPLAHYLTGKDGGAADPHPLFDQAFYLTQIGGFGFADVVPLVDYVAQADSAPSPHKLFDIEYFEAGAGRSDEPALAAYLRQFTPIEATGWRLPRLEIREPNAAFCAVSYLIDNPDLPPTDIPLAHFLRGRDTDDLSLPSRRSASAVLAPPSGWVPLDLDPEGLVETARARLRLAGMGAGFAEPERYRQFGALLQGVRACANHSSDAGLFAEFARERRIAIYAADAQEGRIAAYHRAMIEAIRAAGYRIIAVGAWGEDAALADGFAALCDVAIAHDGPDPAIGWAAALTYLAPALTAAEHILLLTDQLVGPFGDLPALLRRLERSRGEIRTLTETSAGDANFILASGDALSSGQIADQLTGELDPAEVVVQNRYNDLSRLWLGKLPDYMSWAARIAEAGDSDMSPDVAARFGAYVADWLDDRVERLRDGESWDSEHLFWDVLFESGSFPFLRKDLLLENSRRIATLSRLRELLAKHASQGDLELLRDIVPAPTGFPRSYIRLGPQLLAGLTGVAARQDEAVASA